MNAQNTPIPPENTFAPIESPAQFYDAIEARIPAHVSAQARLEIRLLLLDMRKQSERAEIIHWTWEEQNKFYARLDELFKNPGEYSSTLIESVRTLVTQEFANELSASRRNNVMTVPKFRLTKDASFNFPMLEDTTIVWLDLHLTFSPEDTVEFALSRLLNQYRGKYNAIILVDKKWLPSLIHRDALEKAELHMKLSELTVHSSGPFPTIETPRIEADKLMTELNVTILPVVEKDWALNGVRTKERVIYDETRYYAARLDASVKLENLHEQLDPSAPKEMKA